MHINFVYLKVQHKQRSIDPFAFSFMGERFRRPQPFLPTHRNKNYF